MKAPPQILARLKRLLPPGEISFAKPVLEAHAGDKWFATHEPDVVALPRTTASVAALLRFAHRHRIPVTARGAGHGYVGGCVPVRGGIALSLARMNRIREINPADFVAVVEPGVITAELQAAVEKKGLYYPPDPASRADSSIGGNIATNAGGPHCLKYGVTRDYVLGLQAVLADGAVARLGGRAHKNKTGFDFARLLVGSEGTLAVVVEATLKLLPLPPFRACLAVGFATTADAIATLHAIFAGGFLPSALEIADAFTLAAAYRRTRSRRLQGCQAHLIIELDGQEPSVRSELREVPPHRPPPNPALHSARLGPQPMRSPLAAPARVLLRPAGYRPDQAERGRGGPARPAGRLVPIRRAPPEKARLARRLLRPRRRRQHPRERDGGLQPAAGRRRADAALDELFRQVLDWGGAITGEHGIGLAKKPWWPLAVSPETLKLHGALKRALDPRRILNPGKFV